MLSKWRKRRNLKRILHSLPRELASKYGVQEYFTAGQLNKTLKAGRYPEEIATYAQVIFMKPEVCAPGLMTADTYEKIRTEIANEFFDGDIDFVAVPIYDRLVGNSGHSSYGNVDEARGSRD